MLCHSTFVATTSFRSELSSLQKEVVATNVEWHSIMEAGGVGMNTGVENTEFVDFSARPKIQKRRNGAFFRRHAPTRFNAMPL